MREKLVTAVVGTLVTIGLVLLIGEADTLKQEVCIKIAGAASLAVGGLLYKFFENKGLFDKTYAEWRKECLTNKE